MSSLGFMSRPLDVALVTGPGPWPPRTRTRWTSPTPSCCRGAWPGTPEAIGAWLEGVTWRPVLALLLVAPYLGEVLSTAKSPLELLLPWNLALLVPLYGGGALLCRELAHRWGLGLPGLALLGAAYGVYEEALVDRFWFDQRYADATGVGGYGQVWRTNVLLAAHLTAFHAAVSICASILIVTWLFPDCRDRTWVGGRGLVATGIAMLLVLVVTYEDYVRPPSGPLTAACVALASLVAAASRTRRGARRSPRTSGTRRRSLLLGLVAFTCTAAHFVLTYAVPSTGLPWPAGLVVALSPIGAGVVAVRCLATTGPLGHDGLWVVTGILGFFILLDAFVGLGGRYDLTIGAPFAALFLAWLHRRLGASAVPTSPGAGTVSPGAGPVGSPARRPPRRRP